MLCTVHFCVLGIFVCVGGGFIFVGLCVNLFDYNRKSSELLQAFLFILPRERESERENLQVAASSQVTNLDQGVTCLERDFFGSLVLRERVERGLDDRVRVALPVGLRDDIGDAKAIQHTGNGIADREPLALWRRTQEEGGAVPLAAHFVVQRAVVEAIDKRKVLHRELRGTQDRIGRRRRLAHGVPRTPLAVADDDHGTETQDVALGGNLFRP